MPFGIILVSDSDNPAVSQAAGLQQVALLNQDWDVVLKTSPAGIDATEAAVFWFGHANATQGFDAVNLLELDQDPASEAFRTIVRDSASLTLFGVAQPDEVMDLLNAEYDGRAFAQSVSNLTDAPVIGADAPVVERPDGTLGIAGGLGHAWVSYEGGVEGQIVPEAPEGGGGGGGGFPDRHGGEDDGDSHDEDGFDGEV